jgi:uncharacterized protein Usg
MKIDYNLEEIHPKVFLVTIDNSYDLAMTFCRVQEFYESSFKEIKGKFFNMTEFQRMYSMKYGDGAFTYPHDWVGFNVPGYIIDKCYKNYDCRDTNYTLYDEFFIDIWAEIKTDGRYYLIGSEPDVKNTIDHEVAHAFYYLYPKYKKTSNDITSKISEKSKNKIKNWLLSVGYNDRVFKDELQAYLTADLNKIIEICKPSKREEKNLEKISQKLKNLNDEHKNKKI